MRGIKKSALVIGRLLGLLVGTGFDTPTMRIASRYFDCRFTV